jgi:hypothetical protein
MVLYLQCIMTHHGKNLSLWVQCAVLVGTGVVHVEVTCGVTHVTPYPFIESPQCSYSGEVNVIRVYLGLKEGVAHVHVAKYFSLPTISKYIIYVG